MKKEAREFIDRRHEEVIEGYYDLLETMTDRNRKSTKTKLRKLIGEDPSFLDSYLVLFEMLQEEGKIAEAETLLNSAFNQAMGAILNRNGEWPDSLAWGWLENRHIIRTICNKAIELWIEGDTEYALDLFGKLLATNPNDNIGARFYILAIKEKMSFEEYESRFTEKDVFGSGIIEWFEKGSKKFPEVLGETSDEAGDS